MGNSSSNPNGFWAPGKLFQRNQKKNGSKRRSVKHTEPKNAPPIAPMYDTVAEDIPVYSVVDKSRHKNVKAEENVQYAEIEVIRRQTKKNKPAILPKPTETEYATINFPPQNNSTRRQKASQQNPATNHGRVASGLQPPKKYNPSNGTLV